MRLSQKRARKVVEAAVLLDASMSIEI